MSVIHGANYGRPSLDLNFAKNKSLIDTVSGQNLVTFSRAQANYLTTYVGADGLIKYASANEPRFDHNPLTGECLGLLVEESRSNLIPNSSVFTNSGFWQGNQGITISSNQSLAPDGTTFNGTLIQQDTSTSLHQLSKGTFGQQLTSTTSNYTISVFVKKFNANRITLTESYWYALDGYTKAGMVWDFSTESIVRTFQWGDSSQSRIAGTSITKYPNGWYRISLTVIPGSDSNSQYVFPALVIGDSGDPGGGGRSGFAGNGLDGVYIWGFQVEIGSFPTSYIPTSGSTVTRSADNASITGTNFSRWYNQNAGTLFFDGYAIEDGSAASYTSLANVVTGATFNTISFGFSASSSGGQLLGYYNGGGIINGSMPSTSTRLKLAMAMQTNDAAFSRGGAAPLTAGSFTTRSDSDRLIIGTGGIVTGAPANPNGPVSRVTYYPTRLQNYQLQQLTK